MMENPIGFNTERFKALGGREKDIYCDQQWLRNRIFLDAEACKDYDSFRTQATAAKNAYYLKTQIITGKVMETNAPPLATEPAFLIEYVAGNKILREESYFRIWLNVTIPDEKTYNNAVATAAIQKDQQKQLIDDYGYGLAKLQPGFGDNIPKYRTADR